MCRSLHLAAIVRQLQEVEARHPDTAAELDPIIRALSSPEESMIGTEQARKLLGVRSVNTVKRWIELGILAGTWDEQSRRWRIPLAEVLRLRGTQQALAEAGGEDLTPEELATLSATRPGTFPWQRTEQP
jgi:Helix-turn-helix domain